MAKAAIVLTDEEQAQIQVAISDRDAEEALRILREVIWAQIQAARRKGLRGHLEQGQE
jgi:hypothetical protein